METFIELLINWHKGIERGSQVALARTLGLSKVTIGRWVNGDLKPSEIQIKKMAKLFKKNEEEVRRSLGLTEKKAGLKKIPQQILDLPTLGIVKGKEVIFVPSTSIPKKEDVDLRLMFELEVIDDELPPFKKGERIHFLTIDNIAGYEGSYFIVKDNSGNYSIRQLKKPSSKIAVIAVVCGRYTPMLFEK